MQTYIEVHITGLSIETKDILIARLADLGYYGFLEEEDNLKAYINKTQFCGEGLNELSQKMSFAFTTSEIPEINWNAQWESSFEPVLVDDFVAVRADFHNVVKNVEYEIVITPKMSFGTGHHATTFLMMREMKNHVWLNKTVLDFGTGTGILAILAAKLGAARITAIDNDPWCIENGHENLLRNGVLNVEMVLSGELTPQKTFDIILANINKHILLQHAQVLIDSLPKGGKLIMSGLLENDLKEIKQAYLRLGEPLNIRTKNNWLLISFMK